MNSSEKKFNNTQKRFNMNVGDDDVFDDVQDTLSGDESDTI